MRKLALGRTDLYVDVDDFVAHALNREEFRNSSIRAAGALETIALYPFLQVRHSALAPRLAAVLKTMKANGNTERYKAALQKETSCRVC
ncbi:MAG: hypothetical protein V4724_29455 [Pseudomonadota bacterium]